VGVSVEAHKAAIGRFFDDEGSAISMHRYEGGMMRQFGATG
jgi:hypothetical protein